MIISPISSTENRAQFRVAGGPEFGSRDWVCHNFPVPRFLQLLTLSLLAGACASTGGALGPGDAPPSPCQQHCLDARRRCEARERKCSQASSGTGGVLCPTLGCDATWLGCSDVCSSREAPPPVAPVVP